MAIWLESPGQHNNQYQLSLNATFTTQLGRSWYSSTKSQWLLEKAQSDHRVFTVSPSYMTTCLSHVWNVILTIGLIITISMANEHVGSLWKACDNVFYKLTWCIHQAELVSLTLLCTWTVRQWYMQMNLMSRYRWCYTQTRLTLRPSAVPPPLNSETR